MSNSSANNHCGVAAVLSFVVTGLGQIYNGEIKKGLWLVSLATIGVVLILLGALILGMVLYYGAFTFKLLFVSFVLLVVGGVLVCWTGIYSIYNAYKGSRK